MKTLLLLRGLPGAGKTTLANALGGVNLEADMYFISRETGEYIFDKYKITNAHAWCIEQVQSWMESQEPLVIVSNTFTQEWEMNSYNVLAKKYGYQVHSVVVENRHEGVNEHGVPAEKLEQMKNRFEVKL